MALWQSTRMMLPGSSPASPGKGLQVEDDVKDHCSKLSFWRTAECVASAGAGAGAGAGAPKLFRAQQKVMNVLW